MSDFETEAWEASLAAANQDDTAATEFNPVAAEEPVLAAAHTDSTPEAEEVQEEQETTELEDTDAEATDQTEPNPPADDDFQDLLDDLPTKEQILAKWDRIPNAAKEAMTELADKARTFRDTVAKIGGEEAIPIFEPVSTLLAKSDPSIEESVAAYSSMFQANPLASARLVVDAASHFMRSQDAGHKDVGDAIARDVFGVDVEHIKGLLQLEQAGFVNLEEDLPAVMENGSTLFEKQASALSTAQDKIRQLEDLIRNPEKIQSASESNAGVELDKYVVAQIDTAISPFIERGRWTEAKELTGYIKNSILAELRNEPEYKDVAKHVKQNGSFKPEAMSWAVKQSINTLQNKAKGRFQLAMQKVNADFKALAGSSRNAGIKERTKETKPGSITLISKQQNGFSTKYVDPLDAIEAEAFKSSGMRAAG